MSKITDNTTETLGTPTWSFGEKLAGTTFNPSNDSDVDRVKQSAANFMNEIDNANRNTKVSLGGQDTLNSIWEAAKMRALEAQMLAVKAITWKY